MSLTGVAILCLLVVGVWGQCCPPDVYEITEDVYAEVRKNGTAEITRVRFLIDFYKCHEKGNVLQIMIKFISSTKFDRYLRLHIRTVHIKLLID